MVYHTTRHPDVEPYMHTSSFGDLRETVDQAVLAMMGRGDDFDVIAVQGTSGMSVGFPLALAIDKPIVVIRKDYEMDPVNSHAEGRIVGNGRGVLQGARVLFVDDFVSMGQTRGRVRMAVEAAGAEMVAQYMARDEEYQVL